MVLQSGVRLGPYEIVAPIGAGGMGEVYRARDTRLKRDVAVKIVPEPLAQDPTALSRFEREAQAVAALSHPNVLAIHDVGTEGDVSFVVMELLEGETLRECLRRSAIPWRKAVKYGVAIADGLAAAHAKGIIHRDLKPENIFLTSGGLVKILDFGLARMAPAATNMPPEKQTDTPTMTLDTRPGTVLGTVNYMSPEQISGRRTDPRTDIFSFGCVLYEMISGQRAFSGESIAETTTAILRDEPPTLSDSGRNVPVELDRVITRCHEKKPEQRIQSARDLAFALRDLLTDSGPSKSVTLAGPRIRTMLGLQVVVAVMALAILIVALNVGGWRDRLFPRPPMGSIRSLAVMPLDNLSGDPDQEYFADGMTGELITTLGKIKALKVISRMSVMGYKDTNKSPAEIARELNVDALVEGTVTRMGNRVRIAANLIGGSTSEQLWGDSYERDLRDVLAMQGEIAREIAQEIQVSLTPQDERNLARAPNVDPDAYRAYLRGQDHLTSYSEASGRMAIEMFERAVGIDPDFALAFAGLSMAHARLYVFGVDHTDARAAKAKTAADRALALQPDLAEARLALANYWYQCRLEYDKALEVLEAAGRTSPNHLGILRTSAFVRRRRGQVKEAVVDLQRVFDLSPREAGTAVELAWTYATLRRFEEAVYYYDRAIALAPDQANAYAWKADAYILWRGDTVSARATLADMPRQGTKDATLHLWEVEVLERHYPAALDHLEFSIAESRTDPSDFVQTALLAGFTYRLIADHAQARAAFDSARKTSQLLLTEKSNDPVLHGRLAMAYAGLGRKEEALREVSRGEALVPISRDAVVGPVRAVELAYTYVLLDEHDEALRQIEYLLSIPTDRLSVAKLQIDPRWDPLRDHPRYKALVRRYTLGSTPGAAPPADLSEADRGRASGVSPARADRIMLAVLPFGDMSPEPHEWFSDGMTEEMIGALGRLNPDGLGVIARTSAMCYKNTGKGINEIGNELGVDYIVEGSVRRAGARLRISAKLIQVRDQTQLWSESYDRMAEDVFAIQSEVAREVAAALALRLLPDRQVALSHVATADSAAYDAYLKGMFHWNKRTESALHRAVEYFEAAIRADSNYARAHAGLAMANVVLCGHKYVVPEPTYKRMHASAERALALDNTLGEAHLVLAVYNSSARWDFPQAEREFLKAIELSPNHATARQWYAEYLAGRGRVTEALHQIGEARKLDPASRIISSSIAGIYYIAHRFADAVARAREALSFDPEFAHAHFILGVSLAQQRKFDEATSELNKAVALGGDSSEYVAALAHVYALAGRTQEADELLGVLDQTAQTKYVPAYAVATVYAGLGRVDEAFRHLNKAVDQKDPFLGWFFLNDPMMNPLRDDPRFDRLLRRIGIEDDLSPQSRIGPRDRTIGPAALPFENMNPNPQDRLGDGLTEERMAPSGRLQPTKLELIAQRPATPHGHGVFRH